jgi:transposase
VDEACARIARLSPETKTGPGRSTVPSCDLAKVLMLQSYFGVSNRVTAGLVHVFGEKLHISSEFSYKTIERGYDPSRVTSILEEVFCITNEMGNSGESTFAADAAAPGQR